MTKSPVSPDVIDNLKQQAAEAAVQYISSDMIVGLGHGSTAVKALHLIAKRLQSGEIKNIKAIPCSLEIEQEAIRHKIPLTTLSEHPQIDITIDGADEIDPHLNLIKGGGGALLREKIIACATKREVIIADESKLVPALGTNFKIPIEIVPFALSSVFIFLKQINGAPEIRANQNGETFVTDQGNNIIDCGFGIIADPISLSRKLDGITGIVEHGLFIGLADEAIIAAKNGIRIMKAQSRK